MRRKLLIALAILLVVGVTAGSLIYEKTRLREASVTSVAMGSPVTIRLFGKGKTADDALSGAMTAVETLDGVLSRTIAGSEVSVVNANRRGTLGADAVKALDLGRELYEKTNGKFDLTMGGVTGLWDFDATDFTLPDERTLRMAADAVGMDRLEIRGDQIILAPGQSLDFGALGKGFACDKICEYLASTDVRGAILDVGGTVGVWGVGSGKAVCKVGVRAPAADTNGLLGEIECAGGDFISTSGTYEKYAILDGMRYHHILDPATGRPVQTDLVSATVVAKSGLLADGLSTSCILLGAKDAPALLEAYGAGGVLVGTDGSVKVVGLEESRVRLYHNEDGT